MSPWYVVSPEFSLGPLVFHWYGLLIGLGVWLSLAVSEWVVKRSQLSVDRFWWVVMWVVAAAAVGARAWHILTDAVIGGQSVAAWWQVWQGGLSIIGALVAGAAMLIWMTRKKGDGLFWFDALVLGMPLGQILGRFGNFINQELYGWPTELPWGVFISPENRVAGLAEFSHFHPLFLYEQLGLVVILAVLWRQWWLGKWQVGSGKLAWTYLVGYILLRFSLDFVRIQKVVVLGPLGFNQVFLMVSLLVLGYWGVMYVWKK